MMDLDKYQAAAASVGTTVNVGAHTRGNAPNGVGDYIRGLPEGQRSAKISGELLKATRSNRSIDGGIKRAELRDTTQQYALKNRIPYSAELENKVLGLLDEGKISHLESFDDCLLPKTRFCREEIEDIVGELNPEKEASLRSKAESKGIANAQTDSLEDVYTKYFLMSAEKQSADQLERYVFFDSTDEIAQYVPPTSWGGL